MKREYAKLLSVLQAYALIATGVRIICTNHVRHCLQLDSKPAAPSLPADWPQTPPTS